MLNQNEITNSEKFQIYSKNDSFIINEIKLAILNEPLLWTALVIVFIINYKTDQNIFIAIFTFYFVTSWSYFTHLLSHTKLFNAFGQFHLLHHNPEYAESSIVFLLEALIDFFTFGGFLLIFAGIFIEKIVGFRIFNYYIILLWSFFYLSYHLINYHLSKPDAHKQHHIDNGTSNFGPEWMDIIFDTKTDNSKFENLNSGIINMVIITIVILYLKDSNFDLTKMFDVVFAKIF
jgi:hypothetical protein